MADVIPKRSELKRRLILGLQALVSVGLVAWLLNRFDFSRSLRIVAHVDHHFLVAGALIAPLVILTLAVRFRAVLKKGAIPLPMRTTISIVWGGQFWNFFLPGSTGGDLYRLAALWSKYPARKTDALVAVFVDRFLATAVLGLAALIGMFFLPLQTLWHFASMRSSSILLVPVAIAVCLVVLMTLLPIARKALGRCMDSLVHKLGDARSFLVPDRSMLIVLGWAVVGHVVNFCVFFCYARAVGLTISFGQVCLILPTLLILLMVPISINGHGVREVLLVLFFTALGIVPNRTASLPETVVALSVVGLSSDMALGLLGGFAFLLGRRERLNGTRVIATPA